MLRATKELVFLQSELSSRDMDLASAEERFVELKKQLAFKLNEPRQNYMQMAKIKEKIEYIAIDIEDMKQAAVEAEEAAKESAAAEVARGSERN